MRQIPRLGEIVGPGIDALRAVRPTAAAWVDQGGRYADVIEGWSAQAAILLRYLAAQVAATRLGTAKGDDLTALARSEFETPRTSGKTAAFGVARMTRIGGTKPGGAIPKGFRFRRDAAPAAVPPVPAMTYVATRDVPVSLNETAVSVPIVATREGADGNAPLIVPAVGFPLPLGTLVAADTPFDKNLAVASFDAGGGSEGESDEDLVTQAKAYATGQYGPVLGAVVAGALRGTGVHRYAARDVTSYLDGTPCAFTGVVVADTSWGYSASWLAQVQQGIVDTFQGFGCAVTVTGPTNLVIAVAATIVLRDAAFLSYTEDLTVAIQAAARAYFDDRPDWYTWTLKGLRAALSRADARIKACSYVSVSNAATGASLAEPSGALQPTNGGGLAATHYLLASNGVSVSYAAPT
jgi:hypothetical protein